MLRPSNELAAVTWLQAIENLEAEAGTDLPKDFTEFVQATIVGGTPDMYLRESRPVVQVDCWAATEGVSEPPWGRASHLAAVVLGATYENAQPLLELPAPYLSFHVQTAYPLSEPRRIPSDEARYARVQFDVQFHWRVP
ncbi:hypothetical protein [Streptomyces californicus]|uniref:hypothetical protein n=1 Tax=Streptomyces californicus TaxID=67351 RepID=UPI0033DAAA48